MLARYWLLPSVSLVSTSRSAIQSELLSKCKLAVEHSASRHLPATSWQYQYPSQQFPFHLSTGLRPVFLICAALFFFHPKLGLLFTVLLLGFLDTYLLIHSARACRRCVCHPLSRPASTHYTPVLPQSQYQSTADTPQTSQYYSMHTHTRLTALFPGLPR